MCAQGLTRVREGRGRCLRLSVRRPTPRPATRSSYCPLNLVGLGSWNPASHSAPQLPSWVERANLVSQPALPFPVRGLWSPAVATGEMPATHLDPRQAQAIERQPCTQSDVRSDTVQSPSLTSSQIQIYTRRHTMQQYTHNTCRPIETQTCTRLQKCHQIYPNPVTQSGACAYKPSAIVGVTHTEHTPLQANITHGTKTQ